MKKFRYSKHVDYRSWGYPGTDGDYCCTTKIWAVIPRKAWEAINQAENWGNHWTAPEIIYEEQVRGTEMSDTVLTLINALGAEEEEEEGK